MSQDNRELLKEHNIKYSKQRSLILDKLNSSETPLSAEQIYDACREIQSSLSLSTIYRILSAFTDSGLVVKTTLDVENRAIFERNRHEHKHHLVCIGCSEMIQICSCPLAEYEKEIYEKFGYKVASHKLEIYGYCPKCLEKNAIEGGQANRKEEGQYHG